MTSRKTASGKASMPGSRRSPSGWRASSLLSLSSLLVFFTLFEIAVRLASPDLSLPQAAQHFRFTQSFEFELPHHQRDKQLGWRLIPGTYGRMRINSDGFRGAEFNLARTPGVRRIAHLGDSCTMGFTIPDDEGVYGARLAALLTKTDSPTETLNFGVDGYSSHQGRLLLDQVLDYVPEYVTLHFGYNDHHYSNASDRDTRFSNPGYREILERSRAYRFLRRHVLRLSRREARLVSPHRRVDLDAFEANLRDMVSSARERGAIPILITTPLRPFAPLIQNEVLAEVDGRQRWVTQDWWVSRELERRGMALEDAPGTQALQDVLEEGLVRYPEWPYLHFLQARELQNAGLRAEARAALERVSELDAERRVMQEYAERTRAVAAQLDVELVDLAQAFAASRDLLFNDIVHPNKRGHRLIAEQLAQAVVRLEAPGAPDSP
jgi:lysophospholipase L1-like esterase